MITLKVYPTGSENSPFIGQIEISEKDSKISLDKASVVNTTNAARAAHGVETIVLLDVSGSMGQNVRRIVKHYLPEALEKIGFGPQDTIKLVTFADRSKVLNLNIKDLRSSPQNTEGCTFMVPGIKNIEQVINNSPFKKIRILAISDGELNDQHRAVTASADLASKLKGSKYIINSTAIRFYTSSSQPDTRGLSSLLQLGTQVGADFIMDINAYGKPSEIVEKMAGLLTDELGSTSKLVSEKPILLNAPWSSTSKEMHLVVGQNTFWLTKLPENEDLVMVLEENGLVDERNIQIVKGEKLDFSSYNGVLKEKIEFFMKRLRILKVINTPEAQKETDSIISYFQELEKCFTINDPSTADILNNTLQSRLAFFREIAKKKSRSVSILMSEIANDDKVSQLNSAQQADYLRSATSSSNSKALARRAIKQGLGFDDVAIREVREMKKHLHELDGIDDSSHYLSFYSQETTLQGIKTVCELDDSEGTLEQMSALEILQLLNIVGIPCIGPVGDFPDPKTYHLTEILLGSFVSMSDIMVVKDSGNKLKDPFSKKEITNVVPFYDDDRIQKFLMKYAKTLLEYTASVGMRNMILDVPHTYKYTVVGGLWNMTRRLDTEKTDINVDVFTKLVLTYKTAVDGIFDYVVPLIKEQSEEDRINNLSFYISNNGITNMISPIISIMEEQYKGTSERSKLIPNILRALYSFEFYQVIRKFFRSDDDKSAKKKQMLDDLLGIDFAKYATPTAPHFEVEEKNPKHHDQPHINRQNLQDIINRVDWIDKVTLLPGMVLNSFKGDEGKIMIQSMSGVSDKTVEKVLGIDFDLEVFKFFCIVQSFLFDSKSSRVDDDLKKMKIEDCSNRQRMNKMISSYIEKQYRAYYQSQLSMKEKEERKMLANELVSQMVETEDITEFIRLFKEGIKCNYVSAVIYDAYQLGFLTLRDRLFDPSIEVPLRKQKLWILIMGTFPDNDKKEIIVWNKGNALKMSILRLEEVFTNLGLLSFWREVYSKYKEKNIYLYRETDKPNRHTHCNSKASFWAMGYSTVGKYFAEISEAERQEYMKVHTHCCGIWDGKLVKIA